jgi:hypothetical protein
MTGFKVKIGKLYIVVGILAILALYTLIFMVNPEIVGMPIDCKDDQDCIVKAARDCKPAAYMKETEDYSFSVNVGNGTKSGCPIKFKVLKFENLFLDAKDKEMECVINTKNFFINSLFAENFETCNGSLVEYIKEMSETVSGLQEKISELVKLYG